MQKPNVRENPHVNPRNTEIPKSHKTIKTFAKPPKYKISIKPLKSLNIFFVGSKLVHTDLRLKNTYLNECKSILFIQMDVSYNMQKLEF